MPRRREVPKREILPDPKFSNVEVAKFVNVLMTRGKKSVAERIIYGALDTIKSKSGKDPIQTYYGPQILHETLERATWHSGQHVRQWIMLLGMQGITPDRPLTPADFAGLPMPINAWDG